MSPEPNPAEHLWDELREKSFHNRVFDSIDALESHLEVALREMKIDMERVHSIVAWPWIIEAFVNQKLNWLCEKQGIGFGSREQCAAAYPAFLFEAQ